MRINEIFYSLQGEGLFSGTPAVFIRFAGCNLKCPFCDTRHETFTDMTEDDIVRKAASYPARHVVITGGEPTLQLTSSFIESLHCAGFFVQIETNGTVKLPYDCHIDWITCSPKSCHVMLERIDELKVIYMHDGQDMTQYETIQATSYSLQPCDYGETKRNKLVLKQAVSYCLNHPKWHLSLQTHKMINIK